MSTAFLPFKRQRRSISIARGWCEERAPTPGNLEKNREPGTGSVIPIATRRVLPPNVIFGPIDFVQTQNPAILVLKRFSAMMLLLHRNVFDSHVLFRMADGKCTVAGLPFKVAEFSRTLFDPDAGLAFHLFDPIRNGNHPRKMAEDMHMILYSANDDRLASHGVGNSSEHPVHFVPKTCRPEDGEAVLCGKHHMNNDVRKRLRHGKMNDGTLTGFRCRVRVTRGRRSCLAPTPGYGDGTPLAFDRPQNNPIVTRPLPRMRSRSLPAFSA
jgi:hypothetical protein